MIFPRHPTLPQRPPEGLERLKWFCWHGNVVAALDTITGIEMDAEIVKTSAEQARLLKALCESGTYLRASAGFIPQLRRALPAGEVISNSMAESAVNQVIAKRMVKKQQMRWSSHDAHLLLQVRTRALNDDLADDFGRWYPAFAHTSPPTLDDQSVAA